MAGDPEPMVFPGFQVGGTPYEGQGRSRCPRVYSLPFPGTDVSPALDKVSSRREAGLVHLPQVMDADLCGWWGVSSRGWSSRRIRVFISLPREHPCSPTMWGQRTPSLNLEEATLDVDLSLQRRCHCCLPG